MDMKKFKLEFNTNEGSAVLYAEADNEECAKSLAEGIYYSSSDIYDYDVEEVR